MIEDFAQDNVRYLELRSTPRANPKTGDAIEMKNVFLLPFNKSLGIASNLGSCCKFYYSKFHVDGFKRLHVR